MKIRSEMNVLSMDSRLRGNDHFLNRYSHCGDDYLPICHFREGGNPGKIKSLLFIAFLFSVCSVFASVAMAQGTLINAMDEMNFQPSEKSKVELVEGKVGKALKFSFDDDARVAFVRGRGRANADWDNAAGFSFWVKGDGSDHLGGIEFVWNEDYSARYAYAFPISGTDWQKITVAWRDLVPELPQATKLIDPKNGNPPSKLGALWFGKWWYWRDYAAHSYAIDEIRLEPEIALDANDYRPASAPLERVLAKLKAGQPITIVTMGDSLTDFNHWANKETNWPTLLKKNIKEKYGSEVTVVNPAIGGTLLTQNLVLMPRWTSTTQPDLVTVLFGFNDYASGMRGVQFGEALKDAVDRIRRATKGRADVLLFTTPPSLDNGQTFAELAEAARLAAKQRNAGLVETYGTFQAVEADKKASLYVHDKVHLGAAGHALVAQKVLEALERAGK
jgi:lysophospholipase L1-like esterase